MTEDDRRTLYLSLLRGIGQVAQDHLCTADKQHDWGEWRRYRVEHDFVPTGPLQLGEASPDTIVRTRAERKCLNCGREQFSS